MSLPHSWIITQSVARVTWQVPHVKQELFTLLEHSSSPPAFNGVCVARCFVFCFMFCRSLFLLSDGHCIVCPLIYGLWLPLRYLQNFLTRNQVTNSITCISSIKLIPKVWITRYGNLKQRNITNDMFPVRLSPKFNLMLKEEHSSVVFNTALHCTCAYIFTLLLNLMHAIKVHFCMNIYFNSNKRAVHFQLKFN
jgi:hypothetical protein